MGTYYVTAAGARQPGAREVAMKGVVDEGGRTQAYDMVLKWVDQDTYISQIVFHFPTGDMTSSGRSLAWWSIT